MFGRFYVRNPLNGWISRNHSLPRRFYANDYIDKPNIDWSVFVSNDFLIVVGILFFFST